MSEQTKQPFVPAREALERLREGNRHFVKHASAPDLPLDKARRESLTRGQAPFAVVLSCSDSRVPSEIVFGQGLGDLFVVRVAGNIVAPSLVGSVEFAAAKFGTRLVVVMGHSSCGAIQATLDFLQHQTEVPSDNIRSIVERCKSPVQTVLDTGTGKLQQHELLHQAIRANVRSSCDHLRHGSPLLEQLVQDEGLMIVGAEYDLESGVVDFFEGV